ncbi:hypothetical protein [Desulfolucanica intricata]|uniref:hypothetical protein n=1 Tax=Desulfolucanica intricata TaxID=1285191 RepID=UPI00082C1A6A|nr:hypothetical protein [Desulfolucanica intricata]
MLGGLIVGLLVGWFISMFGVNDLLIQGFSELTGIIISNAGFYTIFAIMGAVGGALNNCKK